MAGMGAGDWPADDLERGSVLAKRYRVTDFLGHGGMGLVYAALDLVTGSPVAVKLPRREIRSRKKVLARFQQESRAAQRLRGEKVVRVTDVAELDDGTPFIVMELLVGLDLASLIDARGALPPAEAAGYVLQAAAGVAEAHAQGIVHRDLKPHNLFLVADGAGGERTVKVLDFGVSKLGGADAPRVTTTGARLGTPLYVSPEQLVSAKYVTASTDVWSLGVILYELLTGKLPFEGTTAIAVAAAIQTVEPPPPSARIEGISRELDAVVMKSLAKSTGARYASVLEFAEALAPFAAPPHAARFARSLGDANVKSVAHAPERLLPGGTHFDGPREDTRAGTTPTAELTQPVARGVAKVSAPSPVLVVLAALFGVLLLALALVYR